MFSSETDTRIGGAKGKETDESGQTHQKHTVICTMHVEIPVSMQRHVPAVASLTAISTDCAYVVNQSRLGRSLGRRRG